MILLNFSGGAPILLMGLSCIKDQVPMEMEREFNTVMTRIAMYLLENRKGDGLFGNPVTAAFAFQVSENKENTR